MKPKVDKFTRGIQRRSFAVHCVSVRKKQKRFEEVTEEATEEITADAETIQEAVEEIKAEIETLLEKEEQLETEIETALDEITDPANEEQLDGEAEQTAAELETLIEEAEEIKAEIETLQEKEAELEAEIETAFDEARNVDGASDAEVEAILEEIEEIKTEIEAVQEKEAELETEIEAVVGEEITPDEKLNADTDEKEKEIELDLDAAEEEEKEGRMIVEGYAATFNSPYELYRSAGSSLYEQVDPNAFNEAIMEDVILQYDHEGRVFARQSNGTLDIKVDERGLRIRADLSGTEAGRRLYQEIRDGYTTKMSLSFTIDEEDTEELPEEEVIGFRTGSADRYFLRTIRKIGRVYDVSAVSLPANEGTEIAARSAKLERERARLAFNIAYELAK